MQEIIIKSLDMAINISEIKSYSYENTPVSKTLILRLVDGDCIKIQDEAEINSLIESINSIPSSKRQILFG